MGKVISIYPSHDLLDEYKHYLSGKSKGTLDAYIRALHQFIFWLAERPGNSKGFHPELFTKTALEIFLEHLESKGYSVSHRMRVKSAASGFARWLIEEKGLLRRNPARGIDVPAQPLMAPRQLTGDQRYILRTLVDREGNIRGEALFALGYWAGCRVSDVSWLQIEHTSVGPKLGWLIVGYKGGKKREIDLLNQVRRPLYEYIHRGGRDPESPFVFTSQRAERLTEAGIHHWFRNLKTRATKDEWELIKDVTFHDLRHDFAHRAREAGWNIEEIAYYLGHVTRKGTPAIQTTARYTQVSRQHIKEKLKWLKG